MQPARRLLIALPLVMSAALVATVVSSYLHVRTVRATLVRGQADAVLDEIRRQAPRGAEWDDARVEGLFARLEAEGVVCLAIFDENGALLGAAGTCPPAAELPGVLARTEPGEVADLGDRVRVVRRPPHRPDDDLRERLAAAGLPPPRSLLVEIQPRLTYDLEASAVRTLGIGGAASLALVLTALVFWRLALRADRLQEQLERDRRLAALGEMAAVLSHEIRNPLAAMKGHAQLLAEGLAPESRERNKAERVVREAVRLEGLAEDLLSFVRARRIARAEIDPAALVREAAETVGDGRIDLDLDAAPERWPLDPGTFHQALTNLLRNALQASGADGRAEAEARREGKRLVVRVRDRGEGIPAGAEERIFEPFHTTRLRGTGLGLTVARRIVELHGGTLTAANHPGGGAVFEIRVPRS